MSKGVVLGGYQISNVLVAILLVASTTGAGVATDSFSGISEGFDNPLSGPSDNVTQNNQTDDSDGDSSDNQDSSDDGSDSSDSDSDSSDSSDSDSSDSSDSEDDGGFLDDILGGDEQDSENQTDEQDNQNQDETQDNETDDTTDQVNETDPSGTENATAEITAFSDPRSSDFYSAYDTSSVPLVIEFSGENAEYEITLNGESYLTGQVSGTETVNQTIDLSETGEHQIEVEVSQNGEVSDSISRTFEIASDAIQETGFSKSTTVRTGSDATFRLVENGESVADATVYLGDQQGQTDQDGKVTFSIPYQETVTLSTDYSSIQDETFNVTQDIPEPDITLVNPIDTASFDTPTGTDRDVTFEADVEITEDSGTASVMIDGSEVYTQDLSSGTNSISTTQALSGGTHNWQVEVDTPEYNVSSSSRSLTVNEVEVENGLSLRDNATAGEYNYVRLYDSGEPVEGKEITVNGDSIGTTDSNGEVGFEVPNVQEITVSASGYSDITRTVDGYEEADTPLVYSASIQNPGSGEIQTPFEFSATVDAGLADSYEIRNSTNVLYSGSIQENSTNEISKTIEQNLGILDLEFALLNSENGNTTERSVNVDITGYEYLNLFSPSQGASLNTYQPEFYFEINNSYYNADEVKVISNSEVIYQESLTGPLVEIGGEGTLEHIVPNGQNQWKIELVNGREQELGPFEYETLKSPPSTIQLSEVYPEDEATVSETEVEFSYTIATPNLEDNYYVYQSTSDGYGLGSPNNERLVREGNQSYSLTHQFPSSGEYQWKLWIKNNDTGEEVTSISRNLTVN